jgi:hypothetical protein
VANGQRAGGQRLRNEKSIAIINLNLNCNLPKDFGLKGREEVAYASTERGEGGLHHQRVVRSMVERRKGKWRFQVF